MFFRRRKVTRNGLRVGKAVLADFWCNIHCETSPIDLDRFRSDLDDPKILKNPGRSRVSFLIMMFLNEMGHDNPRREQVFCRFPSLRTSIHPPPSISLRNIMIRNETLDRPGFFRIFGSSRSLRNLFRSIGLVSL